MPLIRGQVSIEGRLLDWAIAEPTMPRLLPVGMLSKKQIGEELQRVQQRRAADAAYEAELICGLADLTPDDPDPAPTRRAVGAAGGRRRRCCPG